MSKRLVRSILPHEPPLPDTCKGFLQIQGSFTPKVKPPKKQNGNATVPQQNKPQQEQTSKSTLERCLTDRFRSICETSSISPPNHLSVVNEDPPFNRISLEFTSLRDARSSRDVFRRLELTPKSLMEGTGLPVPTSQKHYQMTIGTTEPLPPNSWDHSTPPKFRRLIAQSGESEADMEQQRNDTRFLVVTNLLDTKAPGSAAWENEPDTIAQAIRNTLNKQDMEVFVPTLASKRPQVCHLGLRTAVEARRIAHDIQETVVHWNFPGGKVKSGVLFTDFVGMAYRCKHSGEEPKEGPQCTSTTDDISIPGLVVIPDFVDCAQEEAMLAVLLGPFAPWAPKQRVASVNAGTLNRAVQHYGYIFDYASSDVLRTDDSCPPMPAVDSSRGDEAGNDLDDLIENSVHECDGWGVVAGVVEKVRRFTFPDSQKYPNLNQMTLNQYRPGEGIGSHIDTPSAFQDGLLSLSVGSGIVMEFKNGTIKKLVYLPRRSLLLMSGDARYKWEHMIVTRKTDTVNGTIIPRGMRVSLTLRTALSLDGVSAMALRESFDFPPVWKKENSTARPESDPLLTPACEREHVHAVYDAIATQWHHTRGKRGALWLGATQFIEALEPGSIVADVGCGDGKYFPPIWEAGSYVIGTDISEPLLRTTLLDEEEDSIPESRRVSGDRQYLKKHPAVAVADCLQIPIRSDSCDAALCVAVLHHLSTYERRKRCMEELVRIVRHGGLVNVQAWALDQEEGSKRRFAANDVFVDFNVQPKYLSLGGTNAAKEPIDETEAKSPAERYSEALNADFNADKGLVVFKRFCHLYRRGELDEIAGSVDGLEIVESGFESGNYYIIFRVDKTTH